LHYCDDHTFDEDLGAIEDFRYYYDCLMAPNAFCLSALKRMGERGITSRPGHGPLLHHNVDELTGRYRTWSQTKAKAETTVAVFYFSDGYSDASLSQLLASPKPVSTSK